MRPANKLQVKLADNFATDRTVDADDFCIFTDEPRLSVASTLDDATRRILEDLLRAGEFEGEEDDAALTHISSAAGTSAGAKRLLLLGLGSHADFDSAALLPSKFAADTPWVHLDSAATSWHEAAQPHAPAGATGTGVRTLVELARG